MKVQTITVDFWGTLLFDRPSTDNRYKKRRLADLESLLAAAGVTVSTSALDRAYEESGAYLNRIWATQRDVPVDDHIRAILAAIDPGLPRRVPPSLMTALIEAYSRPILVVPPAVDDTALAALESLSGGGYKLALISNVMRTPGAALRRLLERFRLLGYFQHTTFSDEVRIRKPAPEIFHLTLRAVAGEPETSVHVGDDPILDVQGARAAGMRVIQVTSSSAARGPRPDLTISRLAQLPEAIEQLES
jgi:putative hydrolase of the HAD superfamily